MANREHIEVLSRGVAAWNEWREDHPEILPDLRGEDLRGFNLEAANFDKAKLARTNLSETRMSRALLSHADLRRACLNGTVLEDAQMDKAVLREAHLEGAKLNRANLEGTDCRQAILPRADLSKAALYGADLKEADLTDADLSGAYLIRTDLTKTRLKKASLCGSVLEGALLVETDLTGADISKSRIYGISTWGLKLEEIKQGALIITKPDEPQITIDNLEVAQFIYLLLCNKKIRSVIDTVTSKVVLILGRFSPERKAVLDNLREALHESPHGYVPVVFDFEKPTNQTTLETVTLLARMARFVIADISDAKSVLQELQAIVPNSPKLPVQPVIVTAQEEPGMFDFFRGYPWFLEVHRYDNSQQLLADLDERVIRPAEAKVLELRGDQGFGALGL